MPNTYQMGETVTIRADSANEYGSAVDPDTSITVTIDDSAGAAKVSAENMTQDDTGRYYYNYAIPAAGPAGTWNYEVIATHDSKVTISGGTFIVAARTT